MDRNRKVVLAFVLAVLVGTAFRFYGLGWGLPYHFHSDERELVYFTETLRTAPSVEQITRDHKFFLYPPLPMYLLIGLVSLTMGSPSLAPMATRRQFVIPLGFAAFQRWRRR